MKKYVNEPMSAHTTFRIGGPADMYCIPENAEELKDIIRECAEHAIPYYVIGRGSNLLVSDDGYRGYMIEIGRGMDDICVEGCTITAGAGASLISISAKARDHGLTGLEFASGIPGSLGGGIVMNAGAYGGEMKDVLLDVLLMDRDGNIFRESAENLELGYRHSNIPDRGLIVLEAQIGLKPGDKDAIETAMRELAAQRREKQPLEYPSAGSTFKRPQGYYAGKLISDAGLKGYTVGGASVSPKHAGFVVNTGGATADDVRRVIEHVKDVVFEQFGVRLEPEIKMPGNM